MSRILILSDLHYACEAEQARAGHEGRVIRHAAVRWAAAGYRRFIWLAEPHQQNYRVAQILERETRPDRVIVNGDLTVDSAFMGVSDPAALQSVRECLDALRASYTDRMDLCLGDHEIGKRSLFGGAGGPRLASLTSAQANLGFRTSWRRDIGPYTLLGMTSTLTAWPAFSAEALSEEAATWETVAAAYQREIVALFSDIEPDRRIVLFCHDPTALSFLADLPAVRRCLPQLEATVLGHLHSPALFGLARRLAWMPEVGLLGYSVRRYSRALRHARSWKLFKPRLCPSPSGIQLLKDGGYLVLDLDKEGRREPVWHRYRLPWL